MYISYKPACAHRFDTQVLYLEQKVWTSEFKAKHFIISKQHLNKSKPSKEKDYC